MLTRLEQLQILALVEKMVKTVESDTIDKMGASPKLTQWQRVRRKCNAKMALKDLLKEVG